MKPNSNESSGGGAGQLIGSQSYRIITQYGDMLVIKQGIQQQASYHHKSRQQSNHTSPHHHQQQHHTEQQQQQQQQPHQARPVIMTFHDIGLNSELQFASFCNSDEVKLMLQTFTMIHVNFIGQEFDASSAGAGSSAVASNNGQASATMSGQPAPDLPDDFKYPNVDQMAEAIVDICTQLKVRSFIGLAVGAGAHVVSALALMRPDLIDGLFLINPVITSCSITEWLYFKMSAIASNHHIGSSASASAASAASSSSSSSYSASCSASNSASHSSSDTHSAGSAAQQQQQHSSPRSGFRKLISAATHLHLSHNHSHHQPEPLRQPSSGSSEEKQQQQEDAHSIGQGSVRSSTSSCAIPAPKPASGSRLRQLIFSRNLRHSPSPSCRRSFKRQPADEVSAKAKNLDPPADEATAAAELQDPQRGPTDESASLKESPHGTQQEHQQQRANRRAPLEYLMYHHFGPASFQRYRRSSDTSSGAGLGRSPQDDSQTKLNGAGSQQAETEADSASSRHSSPASASGGSLGRTNSVTGGRGQLAGGGGGARSARRRRSGSVCMSATYLASFSNERQRQAYIQGAYKHHFYQINSHNLWLFAQSFVKRRTLNLRKDCGAAAHAAAAAATLGTSICTAFVGLAPAAAAATAESASCGPAPRPPALETGHAGSGSKAQDATMTNQRQRQSAASTAAAPMANSPKQQQQQQAQQALVAGTKVKRTFTCQTLIMCSSVPMHCERAFKLMSLLNPLQATWIKTDHLLVLEERPDKVCQALRLFLQGIGYSMSTYERRLRLSSTTGSAGSADSGGSARSSFTADAAA